LLYCWEVMSWEQRKSIVVQLRDFILQLRALTPLHPGKIHAAGVEFGIYDPRQQNKPFGPFETVDQFHEFIGVNYLRQHIDEYPAFQSAFEKCAERAYSTKFSHGDLAPHNITVEDGKVVCIIDWECAGWYPEYWEYTSCFRSNDLYTSFRDMMKEEMEPYPDELEIDHCVSSCSYDDLVSEVKFYRVFINSAQFSSICYRVYVYIHGAVILVTYAFSYLRAIKYRCGSKIQA
jgi:thiamine kinase-like enzyme